MSMTLDFPGTITFAVSFKGRVRDPRASFSWRSAERARFRRLRRIRGYR